MCIAIFCKELIKLIKRKQTFFINNLQFKSATGRHISAVAGMQLVCRKKKTGASVRYYAKARRRSIIYGSFGGAKEENKGGKINMNGRFRPRGGSTGRPTVPDAQTEIVHGAKTTERDANMRNGTNRGAAFRYYFIALSWLPCCSEGGWR